MRRSDPLKSVTSGLDDRTVASLQQQITTGSRNAGNLFERHLSLSHIDTHPILYRSVGETPPISPPPPQKKTVRLDPASPPRKGDKGWRKVLPMGVEYTDLDNRNIKGISAFGLNGEVCVGLIYQHAAILARPLSSGDTSTMERFEEVASAQNKRGGDAVILVPRQHHHLVDIDVDKKSFFTMTPTTPWNIGHIALTLHDIAVKSMQRVSYDPERSWNGGGLVINRAGIWATTRPWSPDWHTKTSIDERLARLGLELVVPLRPRNQGPQYKSARQPQLLPSRRKRLSEEREQDPDPDPNPSSPSTSTSTSTSTSSSTSIQAISEHQHQLPVPDPDPALSPQSTPGQKKDIGHRKKNPWLFRTRSGVPWGRKLDGYQPRSTHEPRRIDRECASGELKSMQERLLAEWEARMESRKKAEREGEEKPERKRRLLQRRGEGEMVR